MISGVEKIFVRSPLFYIGDKFKLLTQISPLFPRQIKRLIEPFVGGGSVFLNTESKYVLANDKDKNVISIHRLLLSRRESITEFLDELITLARKYELSCSYQGDQIPQEIQSQFPKTYFAELNRSGYAKLKRHYNDSETRDPLELYALLLYGFNRMLRFNKKGEFNIPVGNVDLNANVASALHAYSQRTRGRNVALSNMDFEEFLGSVEFESGDFLYVDPPYLIASTEYNKTWDELSEIRLYSLLDSLNNQGVKFALSNVEKYNLKSNQLLFNWMANYDVQEVKSNYINYFDNQEKKIREVLVRNYD